MNRDIQPSLKEDGIENPERLLYQLLGGGDPVTRAQIIANAPAILSGDVPAGSSGGQGVSVTVFGATGDGVTDDTDAVQDTIDYVSDAGGGIVYFPPGTYILSQSLDLGADDVHLVGEGASSRLHWPVDLGEDTWGIDTNGAGIQAAAPSISKLQLRGPAGSTVLGTAGCEMDGVRTSSNVALTDVQIQKFRAGVYLNTNHNVFTRCFIQGNYINVLWPDSPSSKGNQSFYSCVLDGAAMACLGVEGSNNMDYCTFVDCHLGSAPYGIWKYDGAAPSTLGLMNGCQFYGTYWESIGNCGILDESTGSGSGADSIANSLIHQPGWAWGPEYKIAARADDYAIHVRNVTGSRIFQGATPFTAGDVAAFRWGDGSMVIEGNYITNMFAAECPPAQTRVRNSAYEAMMWDVSGTVVAGDVVQFSGAYNTIERCTGVKPPCGVVLGVHNTQALVGYSGQFNVLSETIANSGIGLTLDAVTYHLKTAAKGDPVYAISTGPGGAVGGGSNVNVRWQGSEVVHRGVFDVRRYGAVGDGVVDDTTAVQAAITACGAAGGGVVRIPYGDYLMTAQLTIPYDKPIQLVGEGQQVSLLRWNTGLGSGVHCLTYSGSWNASRQLIRDVRFRGPTGAATKGVTPPSTMYGPRMRSNTTFERVQVSGFYCGAEITGNHNRIYNSAFGSCWYSLYWGPNHESRGDVIIEECNLEGTYMANVGVHPANALDGCSFTATHFGAGPYCFHTPNATIVFQHAAFATTFDNCSFEGYGNGFWKDDQGTRQMYGLQFINCGATSSFADDQAITPGVDQDYHVVASAFYNIYIRASGVNGGLFEGPGDIGWFDCAAFGVEWDEADNFITNAASTDKPICTGSPNLSMVRTNSGRKEYRIAKVGGATAAVTGDVMRLNGQGLEVTPVNVNQAVMGIAIQDRAAGTVTVIQTRGSCSVKTTGSITNGEPMKASSSGTTMEEATDWGDAVQASAKASTSGGFTETQLRLGL